MAQEGSESSSEPVASNRRCRQGQDQFWLFTADEQHGSARGQHEPKQHPLGQLTEQGHRQCEQEHAEVQATRDSEEPKQKIEGAFSGHEEREPERCEH